MALPAPSAAGLNAAPPALLGRAAGVLNTVQQIGQAAGVAVVTVVFDAHGSLTPAAADAVRLRAGAGHRRDASRCSAPWPPSGSAASGRRGRPSRRRRRAGARPTPSDGRAGRPPQRAHLRGTSGGRPSLNQRSGAVGRPCAVHPRLAPAAGPVFATGGGGGRGRRGGTPARGVAGDGDRVRRRRAPSRCWPAYRSPSSTPTSRCTSRSRSPSAPGRSRAEHDVDAARLRRRWLDDRAGQGRRTHHRAADRRRPHDVRRLRGHRRLGPDRGRPQDDRRRPAGAARARSSTTRA